jgi:hypothetical protein
LGQQLDVRLTGRVPGVLVFNLVEKELKFHFDQVELRFVTVDCEFKVLLGENVGCYLCKVNDRVLDYCVRV